jgi:PAS domain S-box-containing protein
MHSPVRVLIIEDNIDDTILEIDELISSGFDITYERVETRAAMQLALEQKSWDCIISDYAMPHFSGLDALAELGKSGKDIPFILISGTIGEETAVEAMKAGANDYIMKNNLKRLVPAFERELREAESRRLKRQAEASIQFEQILLRTLIDNLPDFIYVKDSDCRIIVANKASIEFMGYSSESQVLGKTDLDIFTDENGNRGFAQDMAVLQTGLPIINREEEFVDSGGNRRWLLTTKIPMHNAQGKISGLVALNHDISDRKQIEFELTLAKNQAEESDRLKSAFLANMSHEIRTPLNAILGFSGLLREVSKSYEKTEEYVEIIESSGQQLLTIINDILEISKIEAGQIAITPGLVNINKVIRDLYQQFVEQSEQKNLKLILLDDYPGEFLVWTDENRLKQIMCNLLSNAIKFTPEGKIQFGYTVEQDFIRFSVIDTGIGVTAQDQSIIFKPFRQVETGSTRNFGGNGLGLSISRALVEKLGGSITLKSESNNGSDFSFTIPLVTTPEPQQIPGSGIENASPHPWDKHIITKFPWCSCT